MKMIFDMSSVIWTSISAELRFAGVEVEHNGKKVKYGLAEDGYENAVNMIVKALNEWKLTPKDMVMVFEGKDSKKRRCMIEPTYKALRGTRPPEAYLEFNTLKEQLMQVFRDLGAIAVTQSFVEGDDVIGYLVENMEEDCIVVSNDNDLIVLNGINKHKSKCFVRIGGEVAVNKYGDFDFKLVTLYKATVGDSSDGIKGCPGFGPAAFLNINARYDDDGCHELMQLIATGQRDAVAQFAVDNDCKFLSKIVDNWDSVVRSYRLALIHPEWVHTVRQQLEWSPGMVKSECADERLRIWRGQNRLVTADTFAQALTFLKSRLPENPEVAFDIETTTPDESTDWLTAQKKPDGVDVFGSTLAGFSLTFGKNNQFTFYVSVNHAETANITMVQAREMIEACFQKKLVIQNTSFELSVLYEAEDEDGSKWRDHWAIYGEQGFMPNVLDTKLEASYVDENSRLGLKDRSLSCLGYAQQSFDDTTKLEGHPFKGGERFMKKEVEYTKYKMHELPATHVFGYGADDTICTAALHNFYRLVMMLEHCWEVYLDVEIDAAYLHAQTFCDGVDFSLAKMKELENIDRTTFDLAWATVRTFLIENGWEGTVPPTYTPAISAKEIKEAYSIVLGLDAEDDDEEETDEDEGTYHADAPAEVVKDPILSNRTRTPAKFPALIRAQGQDDFAEMLEGCLAGRSKDFTDYVRRHFTGEPKFKASNKMMCRLLYEVMGLPIKVRNKPTKTMKEKGIREGNPKGDSLAIAYAIMDGTPEQAAILESLKLMQMVKTRNNLYYSKYPYFLHWKDGKLHSSHNQCATNTRRASSSAPNMQQQPKHQKIEGQPARFRETIVPHKRGAVIISMDFKAQELRVIADYSQDKNMLACYVGEFLKDMHVLTGLGIAHEEGHKHFSYDTFMAALDDTSSEYNKLVKNLRALGKKVNFTTEYGAAAPKLAVTMLISEDKAQKYIDAREAAFPEAAAWKKTVVEEAKAKGYVSTMLGAPRHLAPMLNSDDRYISSKAERQAVNFKIQSSSAEMTKKAEGRMWRQGLFRKFDAVCYGPVHDEVLASVMIEDLPAFLPLMHSAMVAQYAKMGVPVESSISFGPSFGEQYEVGSEPTPEAVAMGLEAMRVAALSPEARAAEKAAKNADTIIVLDEEVSA